MSETDGLVEAIQRGSIEHRKAHHDGIWWHCREMWRDIIDESCEGRFQAAAVRAWLAARMPPYSSSGILRERRLRNEGLDEVRQAFGLDAKEAT